MKYITKYLNCLYISDNFLTKKMLTSYVVTLGHLADLLPSHCYFSMVFKQNLFAKTNYN